MDASKRLNLPFISPGQSQKEWMHNEALQRLDVLVAAAVEEDPRNDPPASPVAGSCYIVGAEPAGEWTGHALEIAAFTAAGWRFIVPLEGMQTWVKPAGTHATYHAGAWEIGMLRGVGVMVGGLQVVSSRGGAIAFPAGGATVDQEARDAIAAVLGALAAHGLIAS